jgi:hypothetical protein
VKRLTLLGTTACAALSLATNPADAFVYHQLKTIDDAAAKKIFQHAANIPEVVENTIGKNLPVYLVDNRNTISTMFAAREMRQPLAALSNIPKDWAAFAISPLPNPKVQVNRIIVIFHDKIKNDSDEDQQHAIVHELMHQFDYSIGRFSIANKKFLKAFEEDKAAFATNKKKFSKSIQKKLSYFDYFFSKPYEAFADVAARLMYPPTERYFQEIYYSLFAATTLVVADELIARKVPLNINNKYYDDEHAKAKTSNKDE